MNQYTTFKVFLMCCLPLLACGKVRADSAVFWQQQQYQSIFYDFNRDQIPDLLLQTKSDEAPSLLVLGEYNSRSELVYLVKNSTELSKLDCCDVDCAENISAQTACNFQIRLRNSFHFQLNLLTPAAAPHLAVLKAYLNQMFTIRSLTLGIVHFAVHQSEKLSSHAGRSTGIDSYGTQVGVA